MDSKSAEKDVSSLKKKLFEKNAVRISSSGRKIITPKYVLSTSDEGHVKKKAKNPCNVKEQLQKLQEIAAGLGKKKVQTDRLTNFQKTGEM